VTTSKGRPGTTTRVRALVFGLDAPEGRSREETLATEEPMEVRLGDQRLTVTMRTPGADFELAVGLLHGEGLVGGLGDVAGVRYCVDAAIGEEQRYNVVTVDLEPTASVSPAARAAAQRTFLTSSACGVCGVQSLDALHRRGTEPVLDDLTVTTTVLGGLPDQLKERQRVFSRTGGLHAAGLFGSDGTALVVREDVGRHNAVDKVVGWALLRDALPLRGTVLFVSGRTSYEIVQKAATAGIPVVASVSAPSSLAVGVAEEFGVTLAGFVRDGRLTVYTGAERVVPG
jgi:FdhD protein